MNFRSLLYTAPLPNPMVSMSEGYAMNAADLAGSGSLYPPVSSGGLATNVPSMNANGTQPAKMIPVPGLPSPLQNSSHLQQVSQPQQLPRSNFSQASSMARNLQQLQIPKIQGMYQSTPSPNLSSQKHAGSLSLDQSQQQSPTQKLSLPMGRPLFDSESPSSQLGPLQRQQPVSLQQHHHHQQQLNDMHAQHEQQRQGAIQQQSTMAHQQQVRQHVSQMRQKQSDQQQQLQQASFTAQLQASKSVSQVVKVLRIVRQQISCIRS